MTGAERQQGRKFYIATSLENVVEHNRLRDALIAHGHQITYDWTAHGSVRGHGLEVIREVGMAEVRGVAEADVVFVLLPGGRGTHVELGIAIGRQIPAYVWSPTSGTFLDGPETVAFYHVDGVRPCFGPLDVLTEVL